MKKIKIYGAGSIGNHLAYASRNLGFEVLISDIDEDALRRTKEEIYPDRYGKWDDSIRLSLVKDIPTDEHFDVVFIGTPPDSHMALALQTLKEEKPKVLLIEKPLCTPDLKDAQALFEASENSETTVLVGYNHGIGENTVEIEKLLAAGTIGEAITLYGGIHEHWGGIFKAHPWLSGPSDTYLGFASRGGGACGEHSHGIHIWQHFAHLLGKGKVVEVSAVMDIVDDGTVDYDSFCNLNLRTETGFAGTVAQDVVTAPAKKYMKLQGDAGFLEWHVNYSSEGDAVMTSRDGNEAETTILPKTRPDDFRLEMEHINDIIDGKVKDSPISLERGLDTMMVIAAAYQANIKKKVMRIDYSKGYTLGAIEAI